ncbi:MAG TPA: hypothetical protein ENN80_03385, partial [Candidatus Hydrogenedentes bacterium]|nr:hypothetical protein [Candidatus Hydrogenedentota bacterium]
HRGVNWSWATLTWRGETRDMFAVRGVYARPVSLHATGGATAAITAHSVWKWDDEEPIADERVVIKGQPQKDGVRLIEIAIALKARVKGLEFGGRLGAGYSGFNLRMAPAEAQQIVFHSDPAAASPRRCRGHYSAQFPGGKGRAGVTVIPDPGNPGYPHAWREYPNLNYFQPLFPGDKLIPLSDNDALELKYTLRVHADPAQDP